MNVLVISFIIAGHSVERRLHFRSTEECLVAERAMNHSYDSPADQPDEQRVVYYCDFK
jgi:hypothetical protein